MTDDDAAATILIVEDDAATRTFLAENLRADGYLVLAADGVHCGLELIESGYPDAVIIDQGQPDGSGLTHLRAIRGADGLVCKVDPRTPVLVLSGRAAEVDRLRCFERGGDDFLAKPFSYAELRARIGALLRRTEDRPARGRLRIGALQVDPSSREVHLHGERVALASKEYALLRTLATEPTRVYTKEELLRTVWGYKDAGSTRTLDSHACRLRQKLAEHGERFVVNVWGVGYRLVDGPGKSA